jgi:hypothetical protein
MKEPGHSMARQSPYAAYIPQMSPSLMMMPPPHGIWQNQPIASLGEQQPLHPEVDASQLWLKQNESSYMNRIIRLICSLPI